MRGAYLQAVDEEGVGQHVGRDSELQANKQASVMEPASERACLAADEAQVAPHVGILHHCVDRVYGSAQ